MKNVAKVLAYSGLVLIVVSLILRFPGGGMIFSPRGILEFTQAVLLLSIALAVTSCEKK